MTREKQALSEQALRAFTEQLGFLEQALKAFSYVVDAWGFLVTQELLTFVRFERGPTFIQVFHGRSSFEIDVEVGRSGDGTGRLYTLGMFMELYDDSAAAAYRCPAVTERGAVGRALERVASLFEKYGREIATDSDGIWARLDEVYDASLKSLGRRFQCRQCRRAAEEAWRQRNYRAVVEAYTEIESDLSPAEQKKLAYCRKKLGEIGGSLG